MSAQLSSSISVIESGELEILVSGQQSICEPKRRTITRWMLESCDGCDGGIVEKQRGKKLGWEKKWTEEGVQESD